MALVVWQCAVLAGRKNDCGRRAQSGERQAILVVHHLLVGAINFGAPGSDNNICHYICLRHNIQHSGLARIDGVMYTHELQRIQYEFLFVERVRGLAVRSFLTFEYFVGVPL